MCNMHYAFFAAALRQISRKTHTHILCVVAASLWLQAAAGFDHQQWVQSVSSAADNITLRGCLAQLEAALVSSSSSHAAPARPKGGKGPHHHHQQQPLLSPDWERIVAATPAVKGTWLQCGAEVAAAVLDPSGALAPNLTDTAAAAAAAAAAAGGEEGIDPAAAAAAAPVSEQAQQQLEQQQHKAQLRTKLEWLPATVPALSLRLAALDACVCYPQLQERHGFTSGREIIVRYRYIVKPCPIFDPPTLEQLLLQEKEAAEAAKQKELEKQQSAAAASGSTSPAPAAAEGGTDGSPASKQQPDQPDSAQQQQQQQQGNDNAQDQQQQQDKPSPQPAGALDILALVHPMPQKQQQQQPPQQQQQPGPDKQQQKQQAARKQPPVKPRLGVPSLASVLSRPQRVAFGYSLQGRGLLQLIRGLPPFPDWVSELRSVPTGGSNLKTHVPKGSCAVGAVGVSGLMVLLCWLVRITPLLPQMHIAPYSL
jgi:hypothetical protein